jgi:hypothetical protein
MARSRLTENQFRDADVLSESEHAALDHATLSGTNPLWQRSGTNINLYNSGDTVVLDGENGESIRFDSAFGDAYVQSGGIGNPLTLANEGGEVNIIADSDIDIMSGGVVTVEGIATDGIAVDIRSKDNSGLQNTEPVSISTGDQSGTANTGDIYIFTGDAAGGNSGDIKLVPGYSTATKGRIKAFGDVVISGTLTLSGVGDIYCNDIHTSSGTVYIGELKLSTDGQKLLVNDNEISGTSDVETLLDLTDTPENYDTDKYLKSTASGTEWSTVAAGGISGYTGDISVVTASSVDGITHDGSSPYYFNFGTSAGIGTLSFDNGLLTEADSVLSGTGGGGAAGTDEVNAWTKLQYFPETSLTVVTGTNTVFWDVDDNPNAKVLLDRNITMSGVSGLYNGAWVSLELRQDNTGGHTVAWDENYVFPTSTAPTIAGVANNKSLFFFKSDGSKLYGDIAYLGTTATVTGTTDTSVYLYDIDNSVWLDGSADTLTYTPSSTTNRKTFTISFWFKRHEYNVLQYPLWFGGGTEYLRTSGDKLQFVWGTSNTVTTDFEVRDTTSWYHLVLSVDTTQATAADRMKVYFNGVDIADELTGTLPSLNHEWAVNQASQAFNISQATGHANMSVAEFINVDGQALTASDFGEESQGIWTPKEYTGTYGTNGFYLDFSDSADLGNDSSGNGNDFTLTSITSANQSADSPTNNLFTWNYLDKTSCTLSQGNTVANMASAVYQRTNQAMSSGKWYAEFEVTFISYTHAMVGVVGIPDVGRASGSPSNSVLYDSSAGYLYRDNTNVAWASSWTTSGDIIGVAYDADTGKVWFSKNGVWQASGDPGAGTNPAYTLSEDEVFFGAARSGSSANHDLEFNSGHKDFSYTVPTGFQALTATNLPEPEIVDSSTGFVVNAREGTGAAVDVDIDMQPDFVWTKNMDATDEHKLIDSVRGATKEISSDSTAVEGTDANGLTTFNSDGFSLGTGADGYNDNTEDFVDWCWKKGSTYGFDIVSYEGTGVNRTVGHSLGKTPELIMVKSLGTSVNWAVYHKAYGATKYTSINTTSAASINANVWNNTAPTSSVFTVGTSTLTNTDETDYIAYLFTSIEGFSKIGSYTGNANADGPFVYTGFRPAFLLIKTITGTNGWHLVDCEREPYNPTWRYLQPASTAAQASAAGHYADILSNGFKLKNSSAQTNANGVSYLYLAMAEQPGKYSNAR